MPDWANVDEIEREYNRRIKNSDDDDEQRTLRIEMRERVAEFREAQAQRRELDAHRASLLATLPPGTPAELLSGSTIEEIDASGARLKAYAESLAKANPSSEPTPAELYGRPGSGGGPPAEPAGDEGAQWREDFQKRWVASSRGSRADTSPGQSTSQVTAQEGNRWVRELGAAHLVDHLAKNSSKPAVRAALSQIDPNTLKVKGGGDKIQV